MAKPFFTTKETDAIVDYLESIGFEAEERSRGIDNRRDPAIIGSQDSILFLTVEKVSGTQYNITWKYYDGTYCALSEKNYKFNKRDEDVNIENLISTLKEAYKDLDAQNKFAKKNIKDHNLIAIIDKYLDKNPNVRGEEFRFLRDSLGIANSQDFEKKDPSKLYCTKESIAEGEKYCKELNDSRDAKSALGLELIIHYAFGETSEYSPYLVTKDKGIAILKKNFENIYKDVRMFGVGRRDYKTDNKELNSTLASFEKEEKAIIEEMSKKLDNLYKNFFKTLGLDAKIV